MGRTRRPPLLLVLLCLLGRPTSSVIVSNIALVTETNRTDYVLQGEAATLYCNYAVAPEETVSSVRWEWKQRGSEESMEVYVWRPGRRPVAKEIFFGRTDVNNVDPGFVVIRQAHMEMEGRYSCVVQTNQMTAHTEFNLIVIVDACQENVWNTTLDLDTCSERINMHCLGLFPKPTSACGVYNEAKGTYLTSVPFDRVVTLRNRTYEIFLKRIYSIRDWSSYTNITFRCYFVIDGTSWKRGIRHRLFGAFGCPPTLPSPGSGSYNLSEEKSCWGNPREGSIARYSCDKDKKLQGPDTLVCQDGAWVPENSYYSGPRKPTCSNAKFLEHNPALLAVEFLFVLLIASTSRLFE